MYQMQDYTKCPTMFLNLRHLVLTMEIFRHYEHTGGILHLAYLLELAPVLEQLELHVGSLQYRYSLCLKICTFLALVS